MKDPNKRDCIYQLANSVDVSYEKGIAAVDWAKKHCPSYITNQYMFKREFDETFYRLYFSDPKDQTLFALRWS